MRVKRKGIQKYSFFATTLLALGALLLFRPPIGRQAWEVTLFSFKEMLLVIPPIFVLLGLLDVWVPRAKMIRFMGEESGLRGILLAYFLGAAAAGPLYAAFPIVGVFMKKGVSFRNILIFLGAWSTLKIPMFLFELSSLGVRFAITRLLLDIPGILLLSMILSWILPASEVKALYARAMDSGE
jgi:uncharacterized membrane protein YraQ (UPF0718 family)